MQCAEESVSCHRCYFGQACDVNPVTVINLIKIVKMIFDTAFRFFFIVTNYILFWTKSFFNISLVKIYIFLNLRGHPPKLECSWSSE